MQAIDSLSASKKQETRRVEEEEEEEEECQRMKKRNDRRTQIIEHNSGNRLQIQEGKWKNENKD